jgi:hypothetical protein
MTTLYVAQNGNDTWSGRLPEANAARTDGLFATLARAAQGLAPGNTCLLRPEFMTTDPYRSLIRFRMIDMSND